MIEVRDLRLVEAIHENGSLIRAARVLGVAQPALTRNLAVLEAKLGGQLFERNHRGVIATNLARAILADSAAILESVEKLNRQIGEVRGAQEQDLSVIAGGYIMDSLCITAAAHMLSLFPQVRLRLLTANWSEVPRAVLEREVPIGLADLRGLVLDPSLAVEKLRPHPVIIVARPGHPLALRAKVALPDIMAFPLAFIGRSPNELHKPLAAARGAARGQGDIHPSFPAVTHESPKVRLHLLRQSGRFAGGQLGPPCILASSRCRAARLARRNKAFWTCSAPPIRKQRPRRWPGVRRREFQAPVRDGGRAPASH